MPPPPKFNTRNAQTSLTRVLHVRFQWTSLHTLALYVTRQWTITFMQVLRGGGGGGGNTKHYFFPSFLHSIIFYTKYLCFKFESFPMIGFQDMRKVNLDFKSIFENTVLKITIPQSLTICPISKVKVSF